MQVDDYGQIGLISFNVHIIFLIFLIFLANFTRKIIFGSSSGHVFLWLNRIIYS